VQAGSIWKRFRRDLRYWLDRSEAAMSSPRVSEVASASLMTALTTQRAEGQMVGFRETLVLSLAIWLSAYASTASGQMTAGNDGYSSRRGSGGEIRRTRTPVVGSYDAQAACLRRLHRIRESRELAARARQVRQANPTGLSVDVSSLK
jgi:hypothetical protein